MYFIYLLFSVVAVTTVTCNYDGSSEVFLYDIEKAEDHFNEFTKRFDKNYDGYEREYRFSVFKYNLKKINELNLKANFNSHNVNHFADMTEKEFIDYASCVNFDDMDMTNVNIINMDSSPNASNPTNLDYRDYGLVTEVKNQKTCNDCYIFSAVGNIEGQYAKQYSKLVSLSEQEVLDCLIPEGCAVGGYPDDVMQKLANYGGLMSEADYPDLGLQGSCNTKKDQIVARVASGNVLQQGEATLEQALVQYGPLSVVIGVSPSLQYFGGGSIFNDPACNSGPIGRHAVLLIGYGTAADGSYWLIKNSWGAGWAEQGFFRMAKGVGMCGIGQYAATATIG